TTLGPESDAAKLPVQLLPAEQQGRRPAVGAVMGVVGEVALGYERGDLFRGQPVAGADGPVAGHQAEQVVEPHLPARPPVLRDEVVHDGTQDRLRRAATQDGWIAG